MDEWQDLDAVVLGIVDAAQANTLTLSLVAAWAGHAMSGQVGSTQVSHSLRRLTEARVITKRTAKHGRFYLELVTS